MDDCSRCPVTINFYRYEFKMRDGSVCGVLYRLKRWVEYAQTVEYARRVEYAQTVENAGRVDYAQWDEYMLRVVTGVSISVYSRAFGVRGPARFLIFLVGVG